MPRTKIPKDIKTKHWQPDGGSYFGRAHLGLEPVVSYKFGREAWSNSPGDRVLISTADLIRLDYVAQDHEKTRQILGCGETGLLEKKGSFMAHQRMEELRRARGAAREAREALVSKEQEKKRAQEDAADCQSLRQANRSLGSANNILSRQVEDLKQTNDSLAATVRDLQKQAPFKETRFAEVKMMVAVCHNCSRPTDIGTLHSNQNQCLDCNPF